MSKRKPKPAVDKPDPTRERLAHAGSFVQRAGRAITLRDDALGRALMRQTITSLQYEALDRYALHWLASGSGGLLRSPDLDREIRGSGGDQWMVHRDAYHKARACLQDSEKVVCDQVCLFDMSLTEAGLMFGYRSRAHAREHAGKLLRSGADSLTRYFDRSR